MEQILPKNKLLRIEVFHKTLSKTQQNRSANKRKLFEIVHFTQYFENYLLVQHFSFITDHWAFVRTYSFKEPEGMVARWIGKLGHFSFDIKHRAVKISHTLTVCRT